MKLIFVYNADSGMLNTVKDITQKMLRPANYNCMLCSLTHGTFLEDPKWRSFCQSVNYEMVFLHRDEFEKQYGEKMDYPIVLRENGSLEVSISKEMMAGFTSLDHLIDAVKEIHSN